MRLRRNRTVVDDEDEAAQLPNTDAEAEANGDATADLETEGYEDGSQDEVPATQIRRQHREQEAQRQTAVLEEQHPVTSNVIPFIRSLEADYRVPKKEMERVIGLLADSAVHVADMFGEGEQEQLCESLKADVRELIDLDAEADIRRSALEMIRDDLHREGEMKDPSHVYLGTVKEGIQAYNKKTSRQKYAHSKAYEELLSRIWETENSDAMPPVTDLIAAEEGDETDSDEEIAMGGQTLNYRCPLTLRLFEDPVKSTACPHAFSRDAIRDYIQNCQTQSRPATCPTAGCKAVLSLATLQNDDKLRQRAIAYARRQEEGGISSRRKAPQAQVLID